MHKHLKIFALTGIILVFCLTLVLNRSILASSEDNNAGKDFETAEAKSNLVQDKEHEKLAKKLVSNYFDAMARKDAQYLAKNLDPREAQRFKQWLEWRHKSLMVRGKKEAIEIFWGNIKPVSSLEEIRQSSGKDLYSYYWKNFYFESESSKYIVPRGTPVILGSGKLSPNSIFVHCKWDNGIDCMKPIHFSSATGVATSYLQMTLIHTDMILNSHMV